MCNFAPNILRNLRFHLEGIQFVKIGITIRHQKWDVINFLESHRINARPPNIRMRFGKDVKLLDNMKNNHIKYIIINLLN